MRTFLLVALMIITSVGNAFAQSASEVLLPARTVIQGRMITGVNSDLPGIIVAQVTRDVWDASQRVLVIPRGSFLTGNYADAVAIGQDRVAIAWTQLELPNGQRYPLPGLIGTDRSGMAGVPGEVDRHLGRVAQASLLSSIVAYGAASQLSDRQIGYARSPSPRDQAISGAVGNVQSTVDRITEDELAIEPTIRVEAGAGFSVVVGQDLLMPAYEGR